MTEIPIGPRSLATRSHRHDVPFFGHRDGSRGEVILLSGLVAKIDPALRFEGDFFICASSDLDGSEIDIDDQFSARCYIDLAGDIFFRSNGRAQRNEQD